MVLLYSQLSIYFKEHFIHKILFEMQAVWVYRSPNVNKSCQKTTERALWELASHEYKVNWLQWDHEI